VRSDLLDHGITYVISFLLDARSQRLGLIELTHQSLDLEIPILSWGLEVLQLGIETLFQMVEFIEQRAGLREVAADDSGHGLFSGDKSGDVHCTHSVLRCWCRFHTDLLIVVM
jgi:hypothetical protein